MTLKNPDLISVLIPTYNREAYIGECLESILQQTYPQIRIMVYDDGSTDDTVSIVRSFPVGVLVQGKVNRGISYARNQLLSLCDTRYATWQDSDDVSNIHRIEEQYRLIRQSNAPIVYCQYQRVRGQMPETWKRRPAAFPNGPHSCLGGSLFDADQCKSISFDEAVFMSGSDIIWRKKVEQTLGPPEVVHKRLYYYRIHSERITEVKKRPENREKWNQNRQAYQEALRKFD